MRSVASQAIASLCGFIAAAIAPTSTLPAEPYTIHGVSPLSGWAAFVGGGEKLGIDALSELVNKEGGINGRPVRVEIQDDQSSPQVAVQLLNEIMARFYNLSLHIGGYLKLNDLLPVLSLETICFIFEQTHDALKIRFEPDR